MPISKIISGGQTGADRGGLEAALYCQIPHGGWCPKGHRAEDGVIPAKYELREMTSSGYLPRTEANVVDSDATVVFTFGPPTGGSLRTLEFAAKHGKPWLNVNLRTCQRQGAVDEIVAFLRGQGGCNDEDYTAKPPKDCVLNVAGSRGSKVPWLEDAVLRIMVDVIIKVNPECRSFYPLPEVPLGVKA